MKEEQKTAKKRGRTAKKTVTPKTKESVELTTQQEVTQTPTVNQRVMGKRTPLYKQSALGIKEKPGFVRYQVVESPGEVEKWINGGWRPCTGDDVDLRDSRVQNDTQLGSVLRQVVNRKPGAASQTAIWMEIEEQFYKEDQEAKQKLNDAKQASWNPKNIAKSNPNVYYSGDLEFVKNKQ